MEIAKQMTSRVLLAAAAAITVAVAIIATDLTSPASAQSDDEATGRIVARLLDDGRVEFGWQPAGGARVLPRARYFPPDATVDRWLRSSPVEVGGSAIGRINARLLDDGRIEFAFTPTDGEQITPQARYFPAGARVGRWLRSTEITISPPAAGYTAISAGTAHTCAIRAGSGAIDCWGANRVRTGEGYIETGQADAPAGRYIAVSAGDWHTCAIRANDSAIECWGDNRSGESDAPDGSYTAVSAGGSHTCALRTSGEISCWGSNEGFNVEGALVYVGQSEPPPGNFRAVSAGSDHTCAIRDSGEIACWGSNVGTDVYMSPVSVGQSEPPPGEFRAITAGFAHTCAIRDTEEIACWGSNVGFNFVEEWNGTVYQSVPPTGEFRVVSAGRSHTCAISASDGAIKCWGVRDHAPPR